MTDLIIPQDVKEMISQIKSGRDGRYALKNLPFYFPSADSSFSRVVKETGDQREARFIKTYSPSVDEPPTPRETRVWRKPRFHLPPAPSENIHINLYKEQGCSVPASQVYDDYTLVMEDCGMESLEGRIRGKTGEEQENLFAGLVPEQAKTILAGRNITVPSEVKDRLEFYSNLEADYASRNLGWRPSASDDEIKQFLERTKILREFEMPMQVFIADSITIHTLYRPVDASRGKIYIPTRVDLEKLKKGSYLTEPTECHFSPGTNLSIDAADRLLFSIFKQVEEDTSEANWKKCLHDAYKVRIGTCFRGGTIMKQLQVENPMLYDAFVDYYPGYKDALSDYRNKLADVAQRVRSNGIFEGKEKARFGEATVAISELML